jgi:hypothetical protein
VLLFIVFWFQLELFDVLDAVAVSSPPLYAVDILGTDRGSAWLARESALCRDTTHCVRACTTPVLG